MALFERALDQPETEREAWIDRESGDGDTAAAVRRLLRADNDASVFLASAPPPQIPTEDAPPPERVGVYRLSERLGRGGMGDVFLGERDDGLFDQRVAVKLMRPSLFPQASAAFFNTERRALARLRHRGIARIFDGGVAPGGRPWLVMELMEGRTIDERLHAAEPRRIVQVMAEVCAAVQHAHQNLVVHADIKPSNVLVDAEDQPKLLDFGIAQMMAEPGEAAPRAFPVTPRYASPARLKGERPVPADDIFALGVLLHELLTGKPWPESGASPTPLSDRDFDAIVGKATAQRSDERYESAAALADDLHRWLERRPVKARPQTAPYVLSRYWRRRRWAVTAAAAGVIGLILALGVITALYLEARTAREAAERRFADVRGMAKYMLFDVYDRLDRSPRTLAVRRDLARVGQTYLDQLSNDSDAPADVRLEAIRGLMRLATVQTAPGKRHLGEPDKARANLTRAIGLGEALSRDAPERADVAVALGQASTDRALLDLAIDTDPIKAERGLIAAERWIERASRLDGKAPGLAELKVDHRLRVAELRGWQARYPEAIAEAKTALAWAQQLPPGPTADRLTARAYDAWADSTFYMGDERQAAVLFHKPVEIYERLAAADPGDPAIVHSAARAYWQLGTTYLSLENGQRALRLLQRSEALARRNVAFEPENQEAARFLRTASFAHAQSLSLVGRYDEAITLMSAGLNERIAVSRRVGTPESARDVVVATAALADVYREAGRVGEACAAYEDAEARYAELARRGKLAGMDAGYSLRLVKDGKAAIC